MIVYDAETSTLLTLTGTGIQTLASLPAVSKFMGSPETIYPWTYVLSPDHTKLAFEFDEDGPETVSTITYYVADGTTGDCCLKLDPQDPALNTRTPWGVVFSPDSTQLAVAYRNDIGDTVPVLVTYDVATGQVISRLYSIDIPSDFDDVPYLIMVTDWTDEGIGVYSEPCCHPTPSGEFYRWNPIPLEPGAMYGEPEFVPNDTDTGPAAAPFNIRDEILSTGERVRIDLDPDYPAAEMDGLYIPQNVVMYQPVEGEPQVIYFNPDNLSLWSADWVADGQAVLVRHTNPENWQEPGEGFLLWRDGTKIPVVLSTTEFLLGGTVDGWITQDTDTGAIQAYTVKNGAVSSAMIGSVSASSLVVSRPALGTSQSLAPFAAVTAP